MSKTLSFNVALALLSWAAVEVTMNETSGSRDIWYDPSYASFMFVGDLLLLLWMWGASLYVWRTSGIGFMRLLSLEETTLTSMERPEEVVYASAKELSIIYLAVFSIFNMTQRGFFGVYAAAAAAGGASEDGEGDDDDSTFERKNFHFVHCLPLLMIGYFVFRLVTPWQIKSKWFYFLFKVVCAPFYPVDFQAGYVGDLLTSLVRVLISMAYFLFYVCLIPVTWFATFTTEDEDGTISELTGFQFLRGSSWWRQSRLVQLVVIPALTLTPLLIRLFQCLRRSVESGQRWPHMANAAKYTSAILVVSTGIFVPSVRSSPIWVLCFIGATCYQFVWDLTMDWGIIVKADGALAQPSHSFGGLALRRHRLLGPTYVYFAIMAGNLVLRFAWTLTLMESDVSVDPHSLRASFFSHLTPLVAAAEVLRRMVWGFLRLEWEHIEKMNASLSREGSPEKPALDTFASAAATGYSSVDGGGEKRVYSKVKMASFDNDDSEGDVGDGDGDGLLLDSRGLERMDMANSSPYPNFYATWDPDGRLQSVLPYIAKASRCCAEVDFPSLFEDTDVPLSHSVIDMICSNGYRLLEGMLVAEVKEEGGGKGGEGEGAFNKVQKRRFAEGVLFAGAVLGYIFLLTALELFSFIAQ